MRLCRNHTFHVCFSVVVCCYFFKLCVSVRCVYSVTPFFCILLITNRGGRMSRMSVSCTGRLGSPKPRELESGTCRFKPSSSKTNDFKIDTFSKKHAQ